MLQNKWRGFRVKKKKDLRVVQIKAFPITGPAACLAIWACGIVCRCAPVLVPVPGLDRIGKVLMDDFRPHVGDLNPVGNIKNVVRHAVAADRDYDVGI